MQGRVGQGANANGDVRALLQQVDDQVIAVELQLDIRIETAKLGDVRHDPMQHERHGGVDTQAPGRFFWREDRRSSSSSICARITLACSKKYLPSSVRSMRRVVRLIKVVSSLASRRDKVRLTADGVCPTFRRRRKSSRTRSR